MGFLDDASEGRIWPRTVNDPSDQAMKLVLKFEGDPLVDLVRPRLPLGVAGLRLRGMFHEGTSGVGPSYFPMNAEGRYVPFESEAHEDAVKSAVYERFDLQRGLVERESLASSFGGVAPNLYEAWIPVHGEARVTWALAPELDAKLWQELRETLGDETVDQLMAEKAAQSGRAPAQTTDAASSSAPEAGAASALATLTVGQLMGHIVAEISDAAPEGWVEWVMDGHVEPPPPGTTQGTTRLTGEFWVRRRAGAALESFQVQNVVGPLNAVQDLQMQLPKPDGRPWHRIRIRHRAGSGDVDLSFDPDGPPTS